MLLKNETPFALRSLVALDKRAAEQLIVVLKATFDVDETGRVAVAEEQPDPVEADEFNDEPDSSSMRVAAELGPLKPSTDVLLRGSAASPGRPSSYVDVSFRVGPVSEHARVFGERVWKTVVGVAQLSDPEPFESMPLTWERSYGGADTSPKARKHHAWEPRNPVGCGVRASHSQIAQEDVRVPNIEDPNDLISRPGSTPNPIGFGPVSRNWEPRVGWCGTYDKNWVKRRLPLLPKDFDERFFNAAPPSLIAPGYLQGGEPVEIIGCTASGELLFDLPRVRPSIGVKHRRGRENAELRCDTVIVDTDAMQLQMIFKAEIDVHKKLPGVSEIHCTLEASGS